jgi:hypothetical protein
MLLCTEKARRDGKTYPRRVSVDINIVVPTPITNAMATHATWLSEQSHAPRRDERARSSRELPAGAGANSIAV